VRFIIPPFAMNNQQIAQFMSGCAKLIARASTIANATPNAAVNCEICGWWPSYVWFVPSGAVKEDLSHNALSALPIASPGPGEPVGL
jgi:hypothetical protein